MEPSFNEEEVVRYSRHILLDEVGSTGQARLRDASVLVVGAGGLGCPLVLYLAAAGVGRIGIVDGDTVELSNLQRQIGHTTAGLGRPKAASLAAAAGAINPLVRLEPHPVRLDAENALALVGAYDIVCDATDNFPTRFLVSDACVLARRTLVSAAVLRFEGQLSTFKPHSDGPQGGGRATAASIPRRRRRMRCRAAPRRACWGRWSACWARCRPPRCSRKFSASARPSPAGC